MATEPLNPSVTPLRGGRFAENTSGIIAAIIACIEASGGAVSSYPSNTAGIIQALIDLKTAIASGSGGGGGGGGAHTHADETSISLSMTCGESVVKGDAVYIKKSDCKVYKAGNTTSFDAANVIGLAEESIAADNPVTIVVRGLLDGLSGLNPGFDYFLDTAGSYTETAPGSGGVYSVLIGQALSATTFDVQPRSPFFRP